MGRKVSIRTLTFDEWDALIAGWNDLPRDERDAERAVCLAAGHTGALAPIGYLVCAVCCSYRPPED